jgi:hypothetical protein
MKILLYIVGFALLFIGIFAIIAIRVGAKAEKTMKRIFEDHEAKNN